MARMTTRVGFGYDVHAFATADEGRPLLIGGVTIPFDRGLAGHSDADVLIHAVVDALLGAAAEGDIGTHFPSTDPRWQGAPSITFLSFTISLLQSHNFQIGNLDATIVAERPRLSPYIPAMRMHLAESTGLDLAYVSVKSKTTDGLGFAGRQEGIACYAVALLSHEAP
jgi:2-C-methyl-D-erythritol 2,4-cyclodiphosphate synthase